MILSEFRAKKIGTLFISTLIFQFSGCGSGSYKSANSRDAKILSIGGERLSEIEIADYLRDAGFPESAVPTMVCVAKYESSFYTGATNTNTNGTTDYGLFQINSYYWGKTCDVTGAELMNPVVNAACAKIVYKQQGLNAWYGYQYHRSECDSYPNPGSNGDRGGDGGGGGNEGEKPGETSEIAKLPNKLYSGPSAQAAFCDDIPVGTPVEVLKRDDELAYIAVPEGVCKDYQGETQTRGWVKLSVIGE